MWPKSLSFYCVLIACLAKFGFTHMPVRSPYAHEIMHNRSLVLKHIALIGVNTDRTCSSDVFVTYSTPHGFGNTGNVLIEFIHSLWVAKHVNGTLVVPKWMYDNGLAHFDLTVIKQAHCFTFEQNIPSDKKIYSLATEASFWALTWYQNGLSKSFNLPEYSPKTVLEVSMLYLQVYAALWSSPHKHLYAAAMWVMEERLHADFSYVAIHKRLMEGYCQNHMAQHTSLSDFSPKELPMDSPEWSENLVLAHPLCQVTPDFVNRTVALHGRANRTVFMAWDGQGGGIAQFLKQGAVFSSELEKVLGHSDIKYVDMYLAMNAEFFLLNPLSTFSFQIHGVRLCLGMPVSHSVPLVLSRDLCMRPLVDHGRGYPASLEPHEVNATYPPWVGPASLNQAYIELMKLDTKA